MSHLLTIDMIKKSISEATRILPIIWPLKSSIAVNPLWDLRDKPFEQALKYVQNYIPLKGYLRHEEYLELYKNGNISRSALKRAWLEKKPNSHTNADDAISIFLSATPQNINNTLKTKYNKLIPTHIKDEIITFLGRYFDDRKIKNTDSSSFFLWNNWKQEILVDPRWLKHITHLPLEPLYALQYILNEIQVPENNLTEFFTFLFSQLIGWHGFIKWLESRKTNPLVKRSATLTEIILIWCCYLFIEKIRFSLDRDAPTNTPINNELFARTSSNIIAEDVLLHIWQRAYEITFQDSLLEKLKVNPPEKKTPLAQFVFCIDVRSEALRRHIESINQYETFGYAGFFGSLFSLEETPTEKCTLQAPALVEANLTVHKKTYFSLLDQLISFLNSVFKQAKSKYFSAFSFFEMIGSWMIFPLLQKTFLPRLSIFKNNLYSTYTDPFLSETNIENTVSSMFSFLKTIGLTKDFSPIVIICGHQAKTTNNPFHASFDCGACGGNSGLVNAKVTSKILNNTELRSRLRLKGIEIPESTVFLAGCHETTTDKLVVEKNPTLNTPYLNEVLSDIQKALKNLKTERESMLPDHQHYQDRAYHYAELIPEWGLAKNAAMIIGPRSITEKINLNSRVFLHSYKPELDHDGSILEGILTAPMVVAHWINSQYYFSSTDPEIYGAGNKAIHNIVSKIGVMEGNLSDLKIGLPLQSVFFKNNRIHEPLKLLVIIYASLSQINEVFKRQPEIKSLFDLGWLNLHVVQPGNFAHA